MTLEETEFAYEISVRHIDTLDDFLGNEQDSLTLRGEDSYIDSRVKESADDAAFFSWLSEARLVKMSLRLRRCKRQLMQHIAVLRT